MNKYNLKKNTLWNISFKKLHFNENRRVMCERVYPVECRLGEHHSYTTVHSLAIPPLTHVDAWNDQTHKYEKDTSTRLRTSSIYSTTQKHWDKLRYHRHNSTLSLLTIQL